MAFDPRTATEADYLEVRVLLARARPVRLFRRLARRHGTRVRAAGLSPNCFLNYEREVVVAWSDLEGCYGSVSVLYYRMCEARWFLWVEASWFSFLSCSWGF